MHGRTPAGQQVHVHAQGMMNAVDDRQQRKHSRKHSHTHAHAHAHAHVHALAHAHAHVHGASSVAHHGGDLKAPKGSLQPPPQGMAQGAPRMDAWGSYDAWATVHGLGDLHGMSQKGRSCATPAPGAQPHLVGHASEQVQAVPHRKAPGDGYAAAAAAAAEKRLGKRSKKDVHGCQSLPPMAFQGYEEQLHHSAHLLAQGPSGACIPPPYPQHPMQPYSLLPSPHPSSHPGDRSHQQLASYPSAWGQDGVGGRGAAVGAAPPARAKELKADKKRRLHQHASQPLPSLPSLPLAAHHGGDGGAFRGSYDGPALGAAGDDGYPAPAARPAYGRHPHVSPGVAAGSSAGFKVQTGCVGPEVGAGMGMGTYHGHSQGAAAAPVAGMQGGLHGPDGMQGQSKLKRRKAQVDKPAAAAPPQSYPPQPCLGKHYGYECPGCPGCRRM